MAVQSTNPTVDVTDRPARIVGGVEITDNYQDEYLPLLLNELRRISLYLAEIANENIDFDEVIE